MRLALALALAVSPALADDMPLMGVGGAKVAVAGGAGMKTVLALVVGSTSGWSATAINYGPTNPAGYSVSGFSASEAGLQLPVPIAGTLTDLSVLRNGPTTTGVFDWSIRKNSAQGNNECIEGAPTGSAPDIATCHYAGAGDAFSPGDLIGMRGCPAAAASLGSNCPPNGTVPAGGTGGVFASAIFTSSLANEGMILAGTSGNVILGNFIGAQTLNTPTTELLVSSVMPAAGVVDDLWLNLQTAPGAAKDIAATVFHGTPDATGQCSVGGSTALTVSVSGASTTKNHSGTGVNPITFAKGDCIAFQFTSVSGTPTLSRAGLGLRWKPTLANESIYTALGTTQSTTASQTRYFPSIGVVGAAGNTNENLTLLLSADGGLHDSHGARSGV